MILLAFKIGVTALVVAMMAVIAAVCINHDRIQKILEYVVKGCLAVAVCTLTPAVFAIIWSVSP